MQYPVTVTFTVHGTDEKNAQDRLAQRLEVARLVRPPGTPPEPGMIEGWDLLGSLGPHLHEHSLDTPAALVRGQTGDPLVEAVEHEAESFAGTVDYGGDTEAYLAEERGQDVSTVRPERSGEPPPEVPPDA